MLNKILQSLNARKDLAGWTVRHTRTRGAQVYTISQQLESQRGVNNEKYQVDVLRQTAAPDGTPAMGSGNVTLPPGGDIESAIEKAFFVAGMIANPMHTVPAPDSIPDVPLVDDDLKRDPSVVANKIADRMNSAASKRGNVRLSSAECFAEIQSTHLINSRGIDAEQESTSIDVEYVLQSQRGERETEVFGELSRRRVADFDIEAELELSAQCTLDSLDASPPPSWQGAVILRGNALANFMAGDALGGSVLQTLSSAASKYAKFSNWEIEQSVFKGKVTGDPLTVWANRCIPFGTASNRFDEEGIPARRVNIIHENIFLAFTASQRYADYLRIAPTGTFGGAEVPPGKWKAADLLSKPHVEIAQFSWFNPDPIAGNFATEIRLGYLVENGVRKPFKGGQLVGNYMDALANVHWSAETGFFGNYLGPHTMRFNDLKVAGAEQ